MRERFRTGPVLRTAAAILLAALILKLLVAADPVATKVQGPDTLGNPVYTQPIAPGAPGSLASTVTGGGDFPAAAGSVSLPAVAGKTNYCSGVTLVVGGATAATNVVYTIAGIQGGSVSFQVRIGTGTANISLLQIPFNPPLAGSAANTAITFSDTSPGAGNLNNTLVVTGYVQ